ncbi:hypothetical protein TNCV_3230371 [Trichonephila clavipes]|nr:hypothetical protein TNCV_3230371 [Trichonephila clavipes]
MLYSLNSPRNSFMQDGPGQLKFLSIYLSSDPPFRVAFDLEKNLDTVAHIMTDPSPCLPFEGDNHNHMLVQMSSKRAPVLL